MAKQEILVTPMGEMQDMISCFAIFNGSAKPAKPRREKKNLTYDEIMALI